MSYSRHVTERSTYNTSRTAASHVAWQKLFVTQLTEVQELLHRKWRWRELRKPVHLLRYVEPRRVLQQNLSEFHFELEVKIHVELKCCCLSEALRFTQEIKKRSKPRLAPPDSHYNVNNNKSVVLCKVISSSLAIEMKAEYLRLCSPAWELFKAHAVTTTTPHSSGAPSAFSKRLGSE